jgi:hypothetical protein
MNKCQIKHLRKNLRKYLKKNKRKCRKKCKNNNNGSPDVGGLVITVNASNSFTQPTLTSSLNSNIQTISVTMAPRNNQKVSDIAIEVIYPLPLIGYLFNGYTRVNKGSDIYFFGLTTFLDSNLRNLSLRTFTSNDFVLDNDRNVNITYSFVLTSQDPYPLSNGSIFSIYPISINPSIGFISNNGPSFGRYGSGLLLIFTVKINLVTPLDQASIKVELPNININNLILNDSYIQYNNIMDHSINIQLTNLDASFYPLSVTVIQPQDVTFYALYNLI